MASRGLGARLLEALRRAGLGASKLRPRRGHAGLEGLDLFLGALGSLDRTGVATTSTATTTTSIFKNVIIILSINMIVTMFY